METRLLKKNEQAPLGLLLTADPSATLIKGYLDRGHCYIAEIDNQTAGVYVLVENNSDTAELINIAANEKHQGKGIGKALVKDAIQKAKDMGYKTIKRHIADGGKCSCKHCRSDLCRSWCRATCCIIPKTER